MKTLRIMYEKKHLEDIKIRTELKPGDLGYVIYLHGNIYSKENKYGMGFETYVAKGLLEFYQNYDPEKDRVWICEYKNEIIGFLVLMHRGKAAQLRYFILKPEFRGIGLGKKLMNLFITQLKKCKYESSFLWTTHEQEIATQLYGKYGYKLTERKESSAFGKPLIEQRFELDLKY